MGQLPLLELMGGVAGQLEVEPLIAHIRAAAKAVMRAELCTVFLVSDDRQSLIGRTSDEEGGEPFAVPLHTGLAGFAAISGEVLNLADAQADERFNGAMDRKTGRRTRSVLCMPIVEQSRVIGVCQCVNKLGGSGAAFRAEEEQLCVRRSRSRDLWVPSTTDLWVPSTTCTQALDRPYVPEPRPVRAGSSPTASSRAAPSSSRAPPPSAPRG